MSDTTYELKDGTFNLHKQDPKNKKKESSPDFFGSAKVNNTEFRLSGWGKVSKDGKVYISGYISLPQETTQAPPEAVESFMTTDKIAAVQAGESHEDPRPDFNAPTDDTSDLPFILTIPLIPLGLLASSILSMLC